jgi:hypothetical protein
MELTFLGEATPCHLYPFVPILKQGQMFANLRKYDWYSNL